MAGEEGQQNPFQRFEASLVAVSGAVIGAILALFLITVFTIVTLMACRSHPPTYPDKVIDLPPMHKPHPPYTQRPLVFSPAVNNMPVTQQILPVCLLDRRSEMPQRAPMRAAPFKSPRSPARKPPPNQEWTCYQKGVDRVYINHLEQYV